MLTKYAKDCLKILRTDTPIPNAGNNNIAVVEIKSYLGETKYTTGKPYSGLSNNLITSAMSQESVGVIIGSGTDAESDESYMLSNQIYGSISGSASNEVIYDSINNILTNRLTVTINNNGSSDITINEIGYFTNFATANKGSNVSSSPRFACLMDRTVLSTPVIIAAGTAGVIYYDFVMDGGAVNSRATG